MKKILSSTILLVLFSAASAHAGKVILSTYYPAPFGAYDRMALVPRARLADSYCKENKRSMYYTQDRTLGPDSVRYCLKDETGALAWVPYPGVWTQDLNNNVYLTDNLAENPNGTEAYNTDLKVGIGTTSPENLMHILTSETSESLLKVQGEGTNTFIVMKAIGTSGDNVRYGVTNNDAIIYAGGAEQVRIDSSGNVGIGTTSPGSKLEVAGGYLQLPFYTSMPGDTDCDEDSEKGRMAIVVEGSVISLYVCSGEFFNTQVFTLPTKTGIGCQYTNLYPGADSQLKWCEEQGYTKAVSSIQAFWGSLYNRPEWQDGVWGCDNGGTNYVQEITCGDGGWQKVSP